MNIILQYYIDLFLGSMQDLWVIIEYCPHGDLLHFLKNKRHIHKPTWEPPTDDPSVQFSLTELVSAAYQVARGMEFLTSRLVSKHYGLHGMTKFTL